MDAFSAFRVFLQCRPLLPQTVQHVGHTPRLLKGAVIEGLLVLAVEQADVRHGIWGVLPLQAPATLGDSEAKPAMCVSRRNTVGSALGAVGTSFLCEPIRGGVPSY